MLIRLKTKSDAMKLLMLIPLLFALARADNCPVVDAADVRQRFCNADLVFVGRPVGGMSSLGFDSRGEYAASTTFFSVEDHFKGDDSEDDITIYRTYYMDSECNGNPFPRSANGNLIFASRHEIEDCNFSPPWECIPEELKDQIEEGSFDCSN